MALPPSISGGLRQSTMNLAHRCMRQLYYYIYHGPMKPNFFKALGSAGHRAIELNFRTKLEGGKDAPLQDLIDCFTTTFDAQLPECEKIDGADPVALRDKMTGSAKSPGTLAKFHLAARKMTPKLIEHTFKIETKQGVPITGTVDYLGTNQKLLDFKFKSGRMSSQSDVEKSFQLWTYATALEATGEKVKSVGEMMLKCDPTKPPEVKVLEAKPPTGHQVNGMLDEYENLIRFIDKADGDETMYPLTSPQNWGCSKKWCGYWSICPRGK